MVSKAVKVVVPLVGVVLAILISSSVVVFALPDFKAYRDKAFNKLVDEYIAPELKPLTQNITDHQQPMLALILAIGKEQITTEERLTKQKIQRMKHQLKSEMRPNCNGLYGSPAGGKWKLA